MKALLYKDLWINKQSTLAVLLLGVAVCVIPFPFDTDALPLVYGCILLPQLFRQELQDRWYTLGTMLPYSSKALVGSKYLLAGGVVALLGGAAFFGQLVTHPGATAAERGENALLLMAALLVLYAVFLLALFHLGPDALAGAYFLAIVGLGCLGGVAVAARENQLLSSAPCFPLALLLFLASFPVAVKQYNNRLW